MVTVTQLEGAEAGQKRACSYRLESLCSVLMLCQPLLRGALPLPAAAELPALALTAGAGQVLASSWGRSEALRALGNGRKIQC